MRVSPVHICTHWAQQVGLGQSGLGRRTPDARTRGCADWTHNVSSCHLVARHMSNQGVKPCQANEGADNNAGND